MQTEAKTNLGVRAEITASDSPETWESLAVVQSQSMKKMYLFSTKYCLKFITKNKMGNDKNIKRITKNAFGY